jgi:uncharacterized protein (TIGR02186 family)
LRAAIAILLLLLDWATPVCAEDLVSGLSQDSIEITSNYTGSEIVVFGAIEQAQDPEGRDIVVAVRGPETTMTVRKKERVAGIWINHDQAVLGSMPSYYFLASTRPIATIASAETLESLRLGLAHLQPKTVRSHHPVDPFLKALIRHKEMEGLYVETSGAVEFLSATLFRVRVPVPATVPVGQYTVDVYLFRNGVAKEQSTPLFVDQTGIERRLFNLAHNWPLAYGLSAVVMAVLLGWISSLVFRQNL